MDRRERRKGEGESGRRCTVDDGDGRASAGRPQALGEQRVRVRARRKRSIEPARRRGLGGTRRSSRIMYRIGRDDLSLR